MRRFLFEFISIVVVVAIAVSVLDACRVFVQEDPNSHTAKRWHYLYQYGAQDTSFIDILILGNSHAYTGLKPEDIEQRTGKRCFILASQGTNVTDAYYMLEEALTVVRPKVLIFETYLISDYRQKELTGENLMNQIQSFEARKNVVLKIKSTPVLFTVENAPYAWSATLRNHSYLLDFPELVGDNLKHRHRPAFSDEDYRGRFLCFETGLTDSTLTRYRIEGPPVNASHFRAGIDAKKAIEKIKSLCGKYDIQLVFLTLPMYHEHVSDPLEMKKVLSEVVGDSPWLYMQDHQFDVIFTPACFEDTYNANQHLSMDGATAATFFLAKFLQGIMPAY